jgi:hypothetical protein
MRCGGASPKIVICEARQRRITKKKSVHRTYTCRVWNTLKERKKERKKDSLFSQQQRYILNVNGIPCNTTEEQMINKLVQWFIKGLKLRGVFSRQF